VLRHRLAVILLAMAIRWRRKQKLRLAGGRLGAGWAHWEEGLEVICL